MTEAPECVEDSECPSELACTGEKCRDPCPGVCGPAAQCDVDNHSAVCSCQPGYTGDPYSSGGCQRVNGQGEI